MLNKSGDSRVAASSERFISIVLGTRLPNGVQCLARARCLQPRGACPEAYETHTILNIATEAPRAASYRLVPVRNSTNREVYGKNRSLWMFSYRFVLLRTGTKGYETQRRMPRGIGNACNSEDRNRSSSCSFVPARTGTKQYETRSVW